ncbi:MAG: TolC family protein [Pseudomonadota bacterium]|nr:TolC family protein [Pseudomonadota bacterium]
MLNSLPRLSVLSLLLTQLWGNASAETLSLRQAAEVALNQNPELSISQARVAQAESGLKQADGARMPRVNVSLNATHTNDALSAFGLKLGQERISAADFNPATLNDPAAISNFNTRVEVTAPLYSGGQIGARQDEAQAQVRAAQAGDAAARQQVLLDVLRAYQGVHLARAYIQVTEQAKTAATEYVRVTGSLHKQGMAVKSDLLSARVNLENAKLNVSEARRQEATALDRLKLLLGRKLGDDLDVGAEAVPALPSGDAEALRVQAVAKHPALQALREQVAAAQSATAAARGAKNPQVNVMARHDWNDRDLGFGAASYTLGGTLSWNVFDGGHNNAAIDRAQAARLEQAARLRQAEEAIAFQVTEARRRALEAEERLAARGEAVKEAEEAQRLTRLRYENGVTTLVDVLSTQTQLDRARADLAQARNDLSVSRGQVLQAAGALDTEQL